MDIQLVLAFIVYIGILLAIGLAAHRRHTTAADFMVGGRSLNFWVTALSAHASDMSSWLFMAFPAAVFLHGFKGLWIALGLVGGMWLNWHFIAPRLRVETERYGSYTLNSYLESRFTDTTGVLRLVAAGATLFFMSFYLAAGLTSMGFLFELLLNIDYNIGISVASAVILAYTMFGGYVAVAWTDFFQGCFLCLMIILVPLVSYGQVDGTIWEHVQARQLTQWWSTANVLEGLAWGLGYFGLPHVLTKFMGLRDPKEMHKAKWLGISWQICTLTAAACVGFIAIALYQPELVSNPELVFVEMVRSYFHPFLGGLILCGVLAAIISTMDSQILVLSSTIAEDIYKKSLHPGASSQQVLRISRMAVFGVTVSALLIALQHSESIYAMVFYAWSGLGCAFGPVMLASLLSQRVTRRGALLGMITGVVCAATWPTLGAWLGLALLPTMLVGFAGALAVILLEPLWTSDS